MEARFCQFGVLMIASHAAMARAQPLPPAPAGVQITHDFGFEFSTITSPSNPGFNHPVLPGTGGILEGRGSVGYAYRMARSEISTAQWVEFVNTFSTQANFPTMQFGTGSFIHGAYQWGAVHDPTYNGPGLARFTYSAAGGTFPVSGIGWRQAAMYCNWLHNGKSSDPNSLLHGAYDATTWNSSPTSTYTDAPTHEPGALVWIPTQDEWMKAAGYDPNRFGPGQGGWWRYLDSRDTPPVSGYPGAPGATSSAGLEYLGTGPDGSLPYQIPLFSYPQSQSPWGLLDTSSGAAEYTEFLFYPGQLQERGVAGTFAGAPDFIVPTTAQIGSLQSGAINGFGSYSSFRLATSVPSPSVGVPVLLLVAAKFVGRRKRD